MAAGANRCLGRRSRGQGARLSGELENSSARDSPDEESVTVDMRTDEPVTAETRTEKAGSDELRTEEPETIR